MEIGELINKGLRRQGWSQTKLADTLGVKPPSVAAWISGRASPKAEKLIEIIKILDLKDDFFPEDAENTKEEKMITVDGDVLQHLLVEIEKIKKQIKEFNELEEFEEVSRRMLSELRALYSTDNNFASELEDLFKKYKDKTVAV